MNSEQDIDYKDILEESAELRGVQSLPHRTFYEFGWFLQEMVDLLVFGEFSKDQKLKAFQERLDWNGLDAGDIDTYFKLFKEWSEYQHKP